MITILSTTHNLRHFAIAISLAWNQCRKCAMCHHKCHNAKKSWKSYLPFGIPQIGVTIPQILSKLFVKGNGWLENLNPAQSSQSLLSQTHRKLQYNNVYTISEKDFRWSTTAFSFSLKSLARFGLCLVALKSLVSQYQRESWDRNFMMISMCVSILWAFG